MEQGKLKSFVPLLASDGTQQTYVSDKGTNYKFTVEFHNADVVTIGTAMSNKTQPSWKIGDEYSYEKTVSGANGQYINIKGMKNLTNPFTPGGGSKGPSPEFGVQKAFECAIECTLKFFELNPDIYSQQAEDSVLNKIWAFILDGTESRRWINMSAMKLSLLKMQANGHTFREPKEMKISDWLFNNAKAIADSMETTVKAQVETDKKNKEANQAPH
jgi:hypothetical protein